MFEGIKSLTRKLVTIDIIRSDRGATTVEYALVIAFVVTIAVAAATAMSEPLQGFFKESVTVLTEWVKGGGGGTNQ